MENYIEIKVHECMEEWKSSNNSMRDVMKKYFKKIIEETKEPEKKKGRSKIINAV